MGKLSSIKSKNFAREPTYKSSNNSYLRLKIKIYGD